MDVLKKALLVLEDGRTFNGTSFGAEGESFGEIVFNTSMSGYQEILTDPSYAGQIVCMTYPLIGNYGTNAEDVESRRPWAEGFVVREASRIVSNFRSTRSLQDYLIDNGIVGIEHIDTRALVRHIRDKGAMRAAISTVSTDSDALLQKLNYGIDDPFHVRLPWRSQPVRSPRPGPTLARAWCVRKLRRTSAQALSRYPVAKMRQMMARQTIKKTNVMPKLTATFTSEIS